MFILFRLRLPARLFFCAFLLLILIIGCIFSPFFTLAQGSGNAPSRARGLNPAKQVTQYILDTWQNEVGLQTSVDVLFQSRDGYLWIGTREGLVRFDGVAFTLFDRSTAAFRSNRITAITEDAAGTLWVGTDAGLHSLRNGIFKPYTTKEGLSNNSITSLYFGKKTGILWIGTEGGGLNRYFNGQFSAYSTKDGLTSDAIYSIVEDGRGALWVGTDGGGLNYLNNNKCTPYILDNSNLDAYTVGDPMPGTPVRALMIARDGTLWAGEAEGLNRVQTNGGYVTEYTTANGLTNNDIHAIIQDREGTIWVATGGGGLNRIVSAADGKPTFSSFTSQNGLPSNELTSLLEDREGALWIGMDGGGLARFKDRRFFTYTAKDGLANNNVYTVAQDSTGAMWFGANGGLTRFQGEVASAGNWEAFTMQNGLANNIVYSLLTVRAGMLWIGTRGGLQSFKNGAFTSYTSQQGLPNDLVLALAEDRDSSLWIGTGAGLAKMKYGTFTTFTTKNGLPNDNIRALTFDRDGTLWIGTRGGGLVSYKAGKFTTYTIKDGLSSNFIWAVHEDRDGTLWIGTNGGINRWKGGKFTSCGRKAGLYDDAIFSVTDDAAGWLWMGSPKGVFRVKKAELNEVLNGNKARVICLNYNITDGLKSLECSSGSQPTVCTARDGSLWFATARGVSIVEPLTIPYNPLAPTLVLEQLVADSKRIAGMGALLKAPEDDVIDPDAFTIKPDESFSLRPGISKFEFHYTATSLLLPERVRFRYMLEGYDETWVDAGTRRIAYYTNLPRAKQYRFRVQACNNDGVWNETGTSISFYLKPRFYETWWFYALVFVGSLASVAAFFIFRVRAIQRRNQVLKQMVDEQTAEITQQKDVLAAQAENIKLKNVELEQKNILITASNEQMSRLLDNIESSIRYAKRIQDALLPNHDRMSHALPEYFILYKPRDIVSGDFYWFVEHQGKIALAAADCTGHGVPGAFMSMIGHALLTEIVVEKNVMEPDRILNHLNTGIRRALRQDEGDSRDGMDIALCVIDKRAKTVEYAGAMNPLCIVRNGQLEELKATRAPIGGSQKEDEERVYIKHSLEFDPSHPVMLYVYSDGYQDQFGGTDGRKFMSRRFKDLLAQISMKPVAEQRQILDDTIEAWKGHAKQIDDILVMGIRLK
jgi:ligand-binding sensor domain-containing protein/serine phosphatase RsbU (regulator of sigma subunit)